MQLKIKRLHEHAVLPKYANSGDNGLDLTAIGYYRNNRHNFFSYSTGIAVEIPSGYVGLLFPRSSVSKYDLSLANCVGVLDSSYRGEITFRFKSTPGVHLPEIYKIGDKIGQLVIVPAPKFEVEEVSELSSTERGSGGYGSSGL